MKKTISLLLAFVMLISMLAACGEAAPAATTGANVATESNQGDAILQARRQTVVDAMYKMGKIRWTVAVDTPYSLRNESMDVAEDLELYPEEVITLKAGMIYQGLPYTHGLGNYYSFEDYLSVEPDENGVYTLTIDSQPLNGGTATARIGNSCSGAVQMAWSHVATSFIPAKTQLMTLDYNYLPVGEYKSDPSINKETNKVCEENGVLAMFEAYSQLQAGDAVVRYLTGSGHTMMITGVHIERNKKGNISGESYVTATHQTTGKISHATNGKGKDTAFVDEATGKTVQPFFGIDDKITFTDLYKNGYLPITCKELIDASPVEEIWVKDSLTEATSEQVFEGTFDTNGLIHSVTITAANDKGETVQEVTCYAWREQLRSFPLERFTTEPAAQLRGSLDLSALASGSYTLTYVAELSTGDRHTLRTITYTAP